MFACNALVNSTLKYVLNYIIEYHNKISQLKSQLSQHYQDLQECAYRLHAVFIHSGKL